ncbi:oligosaccharide flippase family protein [Novosphingobium sp.]|uniref:oligosaccharide flippase family protein n=1 Tax=Novosphingobium sp. TaxID=1874826 RepID=UPI0025FB4EB9|nr:oligosaccharide flippase family protein [Novosphingobium sp.]
MSIRRAAVWSLASQYSSFAVQFATSVIISRLYLLPADVGLFSIALAAAMMFAIFQDLGISRFVSGQPDMRTDSVRDYAAVSVAIGWLVALLVALLAIPLARFYDQPRLAGVLWIIAAGYAISPFATVPAALLTRAMNFRALFLANAGSALTGGAVSVLCAAQGLGPASLAWGMLAIALSRLFIVIVQRPVWPRRPRNFAAVRPMISFGSSSAVISLSGAIGMRSQDLIVGRLLGIAATGLFTRATALAGQLSTLMVGAINAVFYPAFARKRDQGEDLGPPYMHLVSCNTALTWPALLGLALAAEPLVLTLYGPNWAQVAALLRWTALGEMFFVAIPLQMDIPILLGRIRPLVWINLLDTAMTVAILTLCAFYGVEAAAFSRILYGAVWFLIYAVYLHRLLSIRVRTMAATYGKSAVCAVAAGAPLYAAMHSGLYHAEQGLMPIIGLACAGVVCWLAALAALRHPAWSEICLAFGHARGLASRQQRG